jgi:hypothetical protein
MNSENVIGTDFLRPYFHETSVTSEIRVNKDFYQYEEMNGKYTVENRN